MKKKELLQRINKQIDLIVIKVNRTKKDVETYRKLTALHRLLTNA